MSDHSSAAELKFRGHANDPMTVEFAVPGDWPPGSPSPSRKLMEKALEDGFPIVVPVRLHATAEQISRPSKMSGSRQKLADTGCRSQCARC